MNNSLKKGVNGKSRPRKSAYNNPFVLVSMLSILLLLTLFLISNYNETITRHIAVASGEYTSEIGRTYSTSTEDFWTPENNGIIKSLSISGWASGEGEIILTILTEQGEKKIYEYHKRPNNESSPEEDNEEKPIIEEETDGAFGTTVIEETSSTLTTTSTKDLPSTLSTSSTSLTEIVTDTTLLLDLSDITQTSDTSTTIDTTYTTSTELEEIKTQFQSICQETCGLNIDTMAPYKLIVKIEGQARLHIQSIEYSIKKNPIELKKPIPDFALTSEKQLNISLADYFKSDNPLTYSCNSTSNIACNIVGELLICVPAMGFIGGEIIAITATDGAYSLTSNPFKLAVKKENHPPEYTGPEKIVIHTTTKLNLSKYFIDPDGDKITYIVPTAENLTTNLVDDQLTIIPPKEFKDDISLIILAGDGHNITQITVLLQIRTTKKYNTIENKEELISQIKVDEPVQWKKRILVENEENNTQQLNLTVDLPKEASDVEIKRLDKESSDKKSKEIMQDKRLSNQKEEITTTINIDREQKGEKQNSYDFHDEIGLGENEYWITYSTPAPNKIEEENENINTIKSVMIYSETDLEYTQVLTRTKIPEKPYKLHLYHYIDGYKADVTEDPSYSVRYIDNDANGMFDEIEWTVPHLSEQYFEIGLATINTDKSRYHPNDTVKLITVVLDKNGYLTSNADVALIITSPDNENTRLTTINHTIIENQRGIYESIFNDADSNGNYSIFITAFASNVNNSFSSYFTVESEFPYDIIRTAPSTTDPWNGPFTSSIKIVKLESDATNNTFDLIESLPINFTVIDSGGAEVTENQTRKTLIWHDLTNDSTVSYTAIPPLITPQLYDLGPVQIVSENQSYHEARPWYLAVDPYLGLNISPVSATDVGMCPLTNSSFIIAWVENGTDPYTNLRVAGYSTNGTILRGPVTVDSTINNWSRVDVSCINSTDFIVAWIDGPSAYVSAARYHYNLTNMTPRRDYDTATGNFYTDVSVTVYSNLYAIVGYIDVAGTNFDYYRVTYLNMSGGAKQTIDTNPGADATLADLVGVYGINNTRIAAPWFDDNGVGNIFKVCVIDGVGNKPVADAQVDGEVGIDAYISGAALRNKVVAYAYYDSGDGNVYIQIDSFAGDVRTNILSYTSIDSAAAGCRGISVAEVEDTGNSLFAVVWQQGTTGKIKAAVYNASGTEITAPFTVTDTPNPNYELLDVVGSQSLQNLKLCNGTFAVAYTNSTNNLEVKTYNVDGTAWHGICDVIPTNITLAGPANNIYLNYRNVNFTFNATTNYTFNNCSLWTNETGTWERKQINTSPIISRNISWINASFISDGDFIWGIECDDYIARSRFSSQNYTIHIDTIVPEAIIQTVSPNPANYTFNSVTVEWWVSDLMLNTTKVNVTYPNGNLLGNFNSNFTLTTANLSMLGTYTIWLYVNDTSGNLNITNQTLSVVDVIDPNITLILPLNNTFDSDGNINFTFNVTDYASISQCKLYLTDFLSGTNSTVNKSYTQWFYKTGLGDGAYNWNITCTDSYGNTGRSGLFTVTVDATDPMISLSYPPNNIYLAQQNVHFNFTPTDDYLRVCQLWTNFTGIWAINQTLTAPTNGMVNNFSEVTKADGRYIWNVWCNDSAEHTKWNQANYTIVIDTIYPKIQYTSLTPTNYTNQTSRTLRINVTHNETNPDTLILYFNGTANTTISYARNFTNITLTNLNDGIYSYYVWLNDSAAHTNQTPEYIVIIDATPPQITLLGPGNDSWRNAATNTVTYLFNATDPWQVIRNCTLFINGIVNTSNYSIQSGIPNNFTRAMNSGYYNWTVRCTDALGNTNVSVNSTIKIDLTYPNISNMRINDTSLLINEIICLNATLNDTISLVGQVKAQVKYPISGNLNVTMSNATGGCGGAGGTIWSAAILNDENGQYNWTMSYVTDNAGNNFSAYPSPNLVWNVTSTNFLNITITAPASSIEINESESNNQYTQSCTANCTAGVCQWVFIYAQIYNSSWTDITPQTWQLVNNQSNYSCLNMTAGTSCNASFLITAGPNYGGNNYSIRCAVSSSTASSTYSIPYNITLNDRPVSIFTTPTNSTKLYSTYIINATASTDDQGISRYSVEIDNNTQFNSPTQICNSAQPNCSFITASQTQCSQESWDCYLRLNVTDTDGLTNNTIITILIDNIGPTASFINLVNFSNISASSFIINVSAADGGAGVANTSIYYRRNWTDTWTNICTDTHNNSPYNCTWSTTSLSDGNYYEMRALATDFFGNIGTNQTITNITLDRTSPTITLISPQNNSWSLSSAIIIFNVTDNSSVIGNCTLMLDSQFNETLYNVSEISTNSYSLGGLTDGNHTWQINCTDNLGNYNKSALQLIKIDTTPPNSTLQLPYNFSNISRSTFQVNASFTDGSGIGVNLTSFYYRINFTENWIQICIDSTMPYNCTWNTSNLTEGSYYEVMAYANDSLGNQGTNDTHYNITIDRTGPVINIISPDNNTQDVDGILNFTFNVTDSLLDIVRCQILVNNSINQTNYTISESINQTFNVSGLAVTNYTWNITCTDSAGNNATSVTKFLRVAPDTTPPTVNLIYPPVQTTDTDGSLSLIYFVNDSLSDIANCTLYINRYKNQTNQTEILKGYNNTFSIIDFGNGIYNWTVNCTDTAATPNTGNSSIWNFTVFLTTAIIVNTTTDTNTYQLGEIANITSITKDEINNPIITNITTDVIKGNTTKSWWNTSWIYRKPIYLNETSGYNRRNKLALVNVTGLNGNISDCIKEIRVVKNISSNNYEIPIEIIAGDNSTYCTILFNANISANAIDETNYHVYYGNPSAVDPGYDILRVPVTIFYQDFENSADWGSITGTQDCDDAGRDYGCADGYDNFTYCESDGLNDHLCQDDDGLNGTRSLRLVEFDLVNFTAGLRKLFDPRDYVEIQISGWMIGFLGAGDYCNIDLYDRDTNLTLVSLTDGGSCDTGVSDPLPANWNGCFNTFLVTDYPEINLSSENLTLRLHGRPNGGSDRCHYDNINITGFRGADQYIISSTGESQEFIERNITQADTTGRALVYFDTFSHDYGNYSAVTKAQNPDYTNGSNSTYFVIIPDTTKPKITLMSPTNNSWNNSNTMVFTYEPRDNSHHYSNCTLIIYNKYNLSNSTLIIDQSNNNFTLTSLIEGKYNWSVNCTDYSLNINSSNTWIFFIDYTKPAVDLNWPDDTHNYSSQNIEFNFTATDAMDESLTCNLTINGIVNRSNFEATNATMSNLTINNIPEGTHQWNITCWDNATNINTSTTRSFVIDRTAPIVNLILPENNTWTNNQTVQMFYNSIDNHLYYCELWGNFSGTFGYNQSDLETENGTNHSFETITLPDGNYVWNVNCTDYSRNRNFSIANFTINIDTINPSIDYNSGTADNNTYWNRTWIYINVTASEQNEANITFYLYLGNYTLYNSTTLSAATRSINFSSLSPNAIYYYNVTIRDRAGNKNTTALRKISLDTAPPSITLNYPRNNSWLNETSVTFNFTAIDQMNLNSCELWANFSSSWTRNQSIITNNNTLTAFSPVSILDGSYIWGVKCNDSAQNINWSTNFTINIDRTHPKINLSNPTLANDSNQTSRNLTINASHIEQNPRTIILYLNSLLNQSRSYSGSYTNFTLTNLIDGTYSYYVWLNDSAGNQNQTVTRVITIDNTPPEITLTGPQNNTWKNNNTNPVLFEYNVTDTLLAVNNCSLIINISINQTNTTITESYPQNLSQSLNDGNYTWRINCTDQLGNKNTTEQRLIKIDKTFPIITNGNRNQSNFTVRDYICINVTVTDTYSGTAEVTALIIDPQGITNTIQLYDNATTNCDQVNGNNVYSALWQLQRAGLYRWNQTNATDLAGNSNLTLMSIIINSTTLSTLNVTLVSPTISLELNESETSTNYTYNQTCRAMCDARPNNCEGVTLYVMYNITNIGTDVNTSSSYILNAANNASCGTLTNNSNCNQTFVIRTSTNSGAMSFRVWCQARSTNVGYYDSIGSINISINDHPYANITHPTPGHWLHGAELFNASSSTDDQGINLYSFEIDNNTGFTSPTNICSTNQPNCTYNTTTQIQCADESQICYLRLNVTDSDGLTNNTIINIGFDHTGPQSTLDMPRNFTNISNYYHINTSSTDLGIGVGIITFLFRENNTDTWHTACIDSNLDSYYNCSWNTSNLTEGSNYEVMVYANDTYGNVGTNTTHYNITIDRTGPGITIVNPQNNTLVVKHSIDFLYNATDTYSTITNCSLILNNQINLTNSSIPAGSIQNLSFSTLAYNNYTWKIQCTDSLGNMRNSSSYNLTVVPDTYPPTITLLYPQSNSTYTSTTVYFRFNVTDLHSGISNCTLILDGRANSTEYVITEEQETAIIVSNMAQNNYTWSINCTDDNTDQPVQGNSTTWNFRLIEAAGINVNITLSQELCEKGELINITSTTKDAFDTLMFTNITLDIIKGNASLPWWNEGYKYRIKLAITNNGSNTMLIGEQLNYTMNTSSLISAGKMRADGADLRLLFWNNVSNNWTEYDRILTNMNTTATKITFQLKKNITTSTNDTSYYIYYGNSSSGAAPANTNNVNYLLIDSFDSNTLTNYDTTKAYDASNEDLDTTLVYNSTNKWVDYRATSTKGKSMRKLSYNARDLILEMNQYTGDWQSPLAKLELGARGNDTDYYYFWLSTNSIAPSEIGRYKGGSKTQLATTSFANTTKDVWHTLKYIIKDNNTAVLMEAYVDGNLLFSYNDSSADKITDAGVFGFGAYQLLGRWDNLSVRILSFNTPIISTGNEEELMLKINSDPDVSSYLYLWNTSTYSTSNYSFLSSATRSLYTNGYSSITIQLVNDRTPPTINLALPNDYNCSSNTVTLNWSVWDNIFPNATCNLTIDGVVNRSNLNFTRIDYNITYNFSYGTHYWNLTCWDNQSNKNTSETRLFTIITAPANISSEMATDNETVSLSWSTIAGATSYNIYLSENYSAGFSTTPNVTGLTTTRWNDTDTTSNTTRYYRVSAVRGNVEVNTSYIIGKRDFILSRNWSLISIPFNLTNWVLSNGSNNGFVLESNPKGSLITLWYFNETNQSWKRADYVSGKWVPEGGGQLRLEPTNSYWLEANQTTTITLLGWVHQTNTTRELLSGWNDVGFVANENRLLGEDTVVNPLPVTPPEIIDAVYRWNPTTNQFEITVHISGWGWWPSFDNPDFLTLEVGKGYYFDVIENGTWESYP